MPRKKSKPATAEEKWQAVLDKAFERARPWMYGKLLRETAKMLQRVIRAESADENGICTCITCGKQLPWNVNEMDAGHFVSGRSGAIVFEENGLHPQCVYCNRHLHGNQGIYRQYMIRKYGKNEVARLEQLRNTSKQWTREELVEKRETYRVRLKAALEKIDG